MDAQTKADLDFRQPFFWFPVRVLLKWPQFIQHQQALQMRVISTEPPPIPLFISHRWQNTEYPDPHGNQRHVIIRFLFEAICLSKGICERFFAYAEPEIVLNPQLKRQLQQHVAFGPRNPAASPSLETALLLNRWLQQNFPFLSVDMDELMAISMVMDDIGIWYDYVSMPQTPLVSDDERSLFEWSLANLSSVIRRSHVLVIWDKQSNDRGWCLYEGVIAEKEALANYDATPNTDWKLAVFDLGFGRNVHPNKQLALFLRRFAEAIAPKNALELQNYFAEQQIVCTKVEDVPVVCKLISDYLAHT